MPETEKPGSALEAVEAAASAAEEESAPAQDDSSPSEDVAEAAADESSQPQLETAEADPTEQPDEGTASSDGVQPEAKGPIPYDRHKSVLTKARKEHDEALKAIQQEYENYKARVAWAEQVDPTQYQQRNQLIDELYANPIEFYQKLGRELEAHPHLGPQFKQPAEWKPPEPALRSEDGHPAYTADQIQQILEHELANREAQWAQKLQAVEERIDQQTQIELRRQAEYSANQQASTLVTKLRENPQLKAREKEIAQAYADIPIQRIRQIGNEAALIEAINTVLLTKAIPEAEKSAKEKTLQTLQKKAAAGSIDPGAAGTDAASRPRNAKELEKFMRKRAGAA